MSKEKTTDDLSNHKLSSLKKINTFLDSLISSGDLKKQGKSDKLCYWLEDWTTFLEFESNFSPINLRRYKRGEIIKVHLGFNVGSEEGGLHYAVVIDKQNAKSSPVLTIIPLTSVKPHTNIEKLKKGSIFLGNELFTNLSSKISMVDRNLKSEIEELHKLIGDLENNYSIEQSTIIKTKLVDAEKELSLLNKMRKEVLKMKSGSIALVNQITTISKIRIYDPKTDHDIMSGIKLSNEKLDMIDNEIKINFTNLQN